MPERSARNFISRAALVLLTALAGAGCAGKQAGESSSVEFDRAELNRRMASVGLEPMSDRDAALPAPERGRYVACRVIRGFPNPALPVHPAGYLIVRVEGEPAAGAAEIRQALREAEPGQRLRLLVRRNPYLDALPEWWETTVTIVIPAH